MMSVQYYLPSYFSDYNSMPLPGLQLDSFICHFVQREAPALHRHSNITVKEASALFLRCPKAVTSGFLRFPADSLTLFTL